MKYVLLVWNGSLFNHAEICELHYENLHTGIFFSAVKIENIIGECLICFDIFAQNAKCWYTLEPPRRVPTIYVFEQK